jgi:adenine-specific DNA-methyltransferase
MASIFGPLPSEVRLLDAGAGSGSLTKAFVARVCREQGAKGAKGTVKSIHATLYEVDASILGALGETLEECWLMCEAAGIAFSSELHEADFILAASEMLSETLWREAPSTFNVAIANPPYRKIHSSSKERKALRSVGIETSNLYTGFIALIQRLLAPGAHLVAITPRSFCNGPYFRPFREEFLGGMELARLHLFESRRAAFREDGVLQENIVFHAVKGNRQPEAVVVSKSSGREGDPVTEVQVPYSEIVWPNDPERFIHIPEVCTGDRNGAGDGTNPIDSGKRAALDGLSATLDSLGVVVSTGRVVDFRLKDALRKLPETGTVPLLYPCHFNKGTVHWPKPEARKPNAILDNDETRQWLVPTGIYLLTKRFTSKEERRRLVACLFEPKDAPGEWIGFENHLNYFHAKGKGLERRLALGLYAFLNSTLVDQYFRSFSGHTQVNATDLRRLAYPGLETLRAIGSEIKKLALTQDEIDELIARHLNNASSTPAQEPEPSARGSHGGSRRA